MAGNSEIIIGLVKSRLDHPGQQLPQATETYIQTAVTAVCQELEGKGIHLQDTAEDNMLVCDYVCYKLRNRDENAGLPEWLRSEIKHRWAREYLSSYSE